MASIPLSPMRLFCRSDQFEVAATVLSCMPHEGFVPIFCVDDPPLSEDVHREVARRAIIARQDSMEFLGSSFARRNVLSGSREVQILSLRKLEEHHALQRQLAPLRAWRKRNAHISRRMRETKGEIAVLLFAHNAQDMSARHPEDNKSAAGDFDSLVPQGMRRLYFVKSPARDGDYGDSEVIEYRNIHDLANLAWRRFRGSEAAKSIAVRAGDRTGILYGLHSAILTGRLLTIDVDGPVCDTTAYVQSALSSTSHEVVLVETVNDAANLLAPIYARWVGAPLLCVAPPDEAAVANALADYERRRLRISKGWQDIAEQREVLAADERLSELERRILWGKSAQQNAQSPNLTKRATDDLLTLFQQLLKLDNNSAALRPLRAAASEAMPADIVLAVGARNVTVFCGATPYSMIDKEGIAWHRKPIGHVTGDKCQLLFNELFPPEPKEDVPSFNLVLDTGHFDTDETRNVLSELDSHGAHTILLDGQSASLSGLKTLSRFLKLEIIFLNTHGGPDEILLGGIPYSSNLVAQWLYLPSAPMVINNSCQSWVGVGREFIAMGARGYIGTLWSIDAEVAARFARHVMACMVTMAQTASEATASFEDSHADALSYIVVGTARGRTTDTKHWIKDMSALMSIRYAEELAATIFKFAMEGNMTSVVQTLHKEFDFFVRRASNQPMLPELVARLWAVQLLVYGKYPALLNRTNTDISRVAESYLKTLDDAIDADMEQERFSARNDLLSVLLHRGDLKTAMRVAREALAQASRADVLGSARLRLAEVLQRAGQFDESLQLLQEARNDFSGQPDIILRVDGRLSQLLKRLGRVKEALRYAQEGLVLADETGNTSEQLAFANDIARLLLMLHQPNDATNAARDCLRRANRAHNEMAALKAQGLLVHCNTAAGNWDEAERLIGPAIDMALRMEDPLEIAGFECDLAGILMHKGQYADAAIANFRACQIFGKLGDLDRLAEMAQRSFLSSLKSEKWIVYEMVAREFLSRLNSFVPTVQMNVVSLLIGTSAKAVFFSDRDEVVRGIRFLAAVCMESANSEERSEHTHFTVEFLIMLDDWLRGDSKRALERASALDQASGGNLELARRVLLRKPPVSYWKRAVRVGQAMLKRKSSASVDNK